MTSCMVVKGLLCCEIERRCSRFYRNKSYSCVTHQHQTANDIFACGVPGTYETQHCAVNGDSVHSYWCYN